MNNFVIAAKIHAPDLEPRERHLQIIETFDQLKQGEGMELTNDHDPKPLYYQFMVERSGQFIWEYFENGPLHWKIIIVKK